jgi:hypothetical protein
MKFKQISNPPIPISLFLVLGVLQPLARSQTVLETVDLVADQDVQHIAILFLQRIVTATY